MRYGDGGVGSAEERPAQAPWYERLLVNASKARGRSQVLDEHHRAAARQKRREAKKQRREARSQRRAESLGKLRTALNEEKGYNYSDEEGEAGGDGAAATVGYRFRRWNARRLQAEMLVFAGTVAFVLAFCLVSVALYCGAFRGVDLLHGPGKQSPSPPSSHYTRMLAAPPLLSSPLPFCAVPLAPP